MKATVHEAKELVGRCNNCHVNDDVVEIEYGCGITVRLCKKCMEEMKTLLGHLFWPN